MTLDHRTLKKAFRNAWILVVAAAIFVVLFAVFAFRTNKNPPEPTWEMGGVPFVPASSHYANDYYSPAEEPKTGESRVNRALSFLLVLILTACFIGCEDGDWLGPVERGLRGAVDGWDMWNTDLVRPYENPMPPTVPGTVPTTGATTYESATRARDAIPLERRSARGALVYRRFCHHCHGPSGDGRIIVGESLDQKPVDLRSDRVRQKTDEEVFEHLREGGDLMIPLAETVSPSDMLLVIEYLRTLADKPSRPYFAPRNTKPYK